MSADSSSEVSAAERRLAAKRFNERVKLFANTTTAIGLGIFVAATIVPNFGQSAPSGNPVAHPWWIGPLAFSILFCVALMSYRFLRSEE